MTQSICAFLARWYRSRLQRGRRLRFQSNDRILVFAPHPDDETLGCGGTIALARRAGAPVTIVIMTDGSRSHHHLMDERELRRVRAQEADKAARTLGVASRDLILLDYPDGELDKHRSEAQAVVGRILQQRMPRLVFLPTDLETPDDHYATYLIATAALRATNCNAVVYEYPIWFWVQWPFAPLELRGRSELPRKLIGALLSNLRLLRTFRDHSAIGDTLEVKRAALHCYESQMTRLIDDSRWRTLHDVAGGAFLHCLLQPFEVFRRSPR